MIQLTLKASTQASLYAAFWLGLLSLWTAVESYAQELGAPALLLSTRCITCHNPEKRSGSVDLSTRAAAIASKSLTPGTPERSRLISMVAAGKMPPTGRLAGSDVKLLSEWIRAGAPYPIAPLKSINPAMAPLWSFQPVRPRTVPHSIFDGLSGNPIDRFVFAELQKKGLSPSPPAPRLALLRRVTVDLTGLPPTPQEIDAFLADGSPNAYVKVVDRLLASPAYGERWGRHWLDVVRYGESNGYEQNHLRPNAWHYRDYVIRAFNEDKPYTDFITEQLAGDVVGKGKPEIEVATGYLVAGVHDTVGIQEEVGTRQQRSNDLDDIVSTTGAAFLGLTVGCAKCHDHKFDPIPQRDYYRLTAAFAGVRHGERAFRQSTEGERKDLAEIANRISSARNEINEIERQARESVLRTRGTKPGTRPAVNARRNIDEFEPVTAKFVRFTVLATRDGTEPCLDELQVFGPGSEQNLALASGGAKATASSVLPGFAIHLIEHLNDGKFGNDFSWISSTRGTGWAQIELPETKRINRVVWSRDAGDIPRFDDRLPSTYRIEVSEDGATWNAVSSDAGRSGMSDYVHPDELAKTLTSERRDKRASLLKLIDELNKRTAELNSRNMAYIGQFAPPDPVHILIRGDVMQRTDEVAPGALSACAVLSPDLADRKADDSARRLALARWLCDPRNPLTARVIVNRVWQHHFGRGIVGTPSDFGRNGDKPSHPELLDWLAGVFSSRVNEEMSKRVNASNRDINSFTHLPIYGFGWKLKALHRLIVTSYTYRQSSAANEKGMAVDAGNLTLWRMPLQRMEAEALRDAILATSGKLDRTMGGPGYRLFKYDVVNVAAYKPREDFPPETWRRSVYQVPARAIRDNLLGTFDCPECSQRAQKRDSTTTALQALTMLNGPFIQQQSGFYSERVVKEAGNNISARVDRAFKLTFGRPPSVSEKAAAVKLASTRGLVTLCRALMNANEFMYY